MATEMPTRYLSKSLSIMPFMVIFILFAACNSGQGTDRPNPKLKTVDLTIGNAKIKAEVALTEGERNRGLMYRSSLKDGEGMLFVFESDQKLAFWMKNTKLPLSLAYILSDGTIVQIIDLVPFSEESRPSIRSVRYALEVPQGWFERSGIKVGDKVRIPSLE
ncbi:MAG TPA: DUF192 domain-containing protein [Rectinema sp.]|jgi:hypothetical protein|nr:DUF192 domain-containing protein [Rectinema sp.]HPW01709.1 DUF192 domain-containing protein [Rectinema sp.]